MHPYLLLNYTHRRRDVLILAHELGHGVHAALAAPQGIFHQSTPLTLAETASVFGEAMTFEALLEQAPDPESRLSLLAESVEGAIATVFRQTAMNRFEDRVHTTRREDGELSVDRFGDLWSETQSELLGDAVELTEGYRTWWSYVPHFIATPGYVYAYAYGQLLALSIYRRWKDEGAAFVPRYIELLSAGGSLPPEALGEIVGVDLADPGFWDTGLDLIEDQLREAEDAAREARGVTPTRSAGRPQCGRAEPRSSASPTLMTSADCSSAARTAVVHRAVDPGVVDQRLDALLLERLAHGVFAVHGPVAAADAGPHALEHLGGVSLGVGAHGRLGRLQHLLRVGGGDLEVDAPGAALLHVGMQALDDLGVLGVGRRDQQPVEGPLLEPHEQASETWWKWCWRPPRPSAGSGPRTGRPRARRLGCARIAVVDVADLVQLPRVPANSRPWRRSTSSTAQRVGGPTSASGVISGASSTATRRGDGARQPQHLEQARGAAREQGESLRALGREVALEPLPYPVDVGAQGLILPRGARGVVAARLALGLVDDRADLGLRASPVANRLGSRSK